MEPKKCMSANGAFWVPRMRGRGIEEGRIVARAHIWTIINPLSLSNATSVGVEGEKKVHLPKWNALFAIDAHLQKGSRPAEMMPGASLSMCSNHLLIA